MFSAIKMHGKPLYRLARKGIEVERKERAVEIYRFRWRKLIYLLFFSEFLVPRELISGPSEEIWEENRVRGSPSPS